ncbi:BTAD domain-containing putative transcriptional regulator [Streptomyces sp. NPDC052036]|uniref:BTAD domain-containing putative transcriptional regulator n=1 Tax=Streptomyces sp. NPDC052036 TaxID=3155171 RepID=UPI003432295B
MNGRIQFKVLGPLEVVRRGSEINLGGIKQRAALGYLLLHANEAVATSKLIAALWDGPAPASARKVVQNAVWRLRRLLESDEGEQTTDGSVALLTRTPGYMLRIEPQTVDLYRFRALVAEGRAEMERGAPDAASALRRDALALWRGPVLADLAETGVPWPELKAIQNTRLDVLEDYFEAELALGHHDVVLPELQATVCAEPRRERLLGQLMLALYRSGRQADALSTYARARTSLISDLGLEPGRELRDRQQAILTHDPALLYVPASARARTPGAAEPLGSRPLAGSRDEPLSAPTTTPDLRAPVRERREVSVVLLRATIDAEGGRPDPEHVDTAMETVNEVVTAEAHRFGGTVAAKVGSLWLLIFGAPRSRDNDAMRAVLTALAIRHRFGRPHPALLGVGVRAAVDTGEALVRYASDEDSPPSATGTALDRCHSMLPLVPTDEVWVGDDVRRHTTSRIDYQRARVSSALWAVAGVRPASPQDHGVPLLDRGRDLDVLLGLLDRAGPGQRPPIALVVGEPGLGKSHLISEFEKVVRRRDGEAGPFVAHLFPCQVDDSPLAVVAEELSRCCGIVPHDQPEQAREKLWAAVRRTAGTAEEADWMFSQLLVLIAGVHGFDPTAALGEVLAAWLRFLERFAAERPVLLVIDDLHAADETLLDFVDRQTDASVRSRLFVLGGARPELFERRPRWSSSGSAVVTIPLTRLPDTVVAQQVRLLLDAHGIRTGPESAVGTVERELIHELSQTMVSLADGSPLFAAEFVRSLADRIRPDPVAPAQGPAEATASLVPAVVRRVIAARLDELPSDARAVLEDMAVAGGTVNADAVAAMRRCGRDTAAAVLEDLAHRGVLVRVEQSRHEGDVQYAFWHELVGRVVYARIPHARRAARRLVFAAWADRQRKQHGRRDPWALAPDGPVARGLARLERLVRRLEVRLKGAAAAA